MVVRVVGSWMEVRLGQLWKAPAPIVVTGLFSMVLGMIKVPEAFGSQSLIMAEAPEVSMVRSSRLAAEREKVPKTRVRVALLRDAFMRGEVTGLFLQATKKDMYLVS